MHTVLLLNIEAQKLYDANAFLFAPFAKGISICRVDETSENPDGMFPGLMDQVNGKGPWRAFVFATEALPAVAQKVEGDNPFDFAKGEPFSPSSESPEPFIRMTHYLGGFPAKNTYDFEEYYYYVDREGVRVIGDESDPVFRAEALEVGVPIQKSYEKRQLESVGGLRELINKYDALANKPAEIYLVKLRVAGAGNGLVLPEVPDTVASPLKPTFVGSNHYPRKCRFLVFDLHRLNALNEGSQMFQFWMSLLTLASNDFNPSLFSTDALYRFKCQLDPKQLQEMFADKLSINQGVAAQARQFLKRPQLVSDEYGEERIPWERVTISYDRLDQKLSRVDVQQYGWAKEIPALDVRVLEGQVEHSIKELKHQLKEPRRKIANMAKITRQRKEELLKSETLLDEAQAVDLQEGMDSLKESLLGEIAIRYLYDNSFTQELVGKKDAIKSQMSKRTFSTHHHYLTGFIMATVLISFLIIFLHTEHAGDMVLGLLTVVGTCIFSLLAVALYHRKMTRRLVNGYNGDISAIYARVSSETSQIKERLEQVLNYQHYQHLVQYRQSSHNIAKLEDFNLRQYVAKLDAFNEQLRDLGREMNLELATHAAYDNAIYFDPDASEQSDGVFYFKPNGVTKIHMPNQAMAWTIPYDGIIGMEIEKEGP
ncbi:MAG: hypothetical protein FWF59_13270 [Turicibacter sp.]|nr:hypothetical protein [Turicibacter sp.]